MPFRFSELLTKKDRERIYFDGGLPLSKRETRLERLEVSRRRLEAFIGSTRPGFTDHTLRTKPLLATPQMVFGHHLPPKRVPTLPENPFIVPGVLEDLKGRWDRHTIKTFVDPAPSNILHGVHGFVWEDITAIVPGEADIFCARAASESGAAVLTGDSDLLVHDLGPSGSVIFFSSVESIEDNVDNERPKIRAMQIRPREVARKLGIRSIQRFAFELKRDPYLSFGKIVQRAKENTGGVENNASYLAFLEEYTFINEDIEDNIQGLDPRISELYLQLTHAGLHPENQPLAIYLPMLLENHFRRCAWREGSEIRAIAFSLLNFSATVGDKRDTILEYSRRGTRVSSTPIKLLSEDELISLIVTLNKRLQSLFMRCSGASILAWKMFALEEIFLHKDKDDWPSPGHLGRFLETGHRGEMLDWDDIHLNAQFQSILYSLRILKQAVGSSALQAPLALKNKIPLLQKFLYELPPMRMLSHSISDISTHEPMPRESVKHTLFVLFSGQKQDCDAQTPELGEPVQDHGNNRISTGHNARTETTCTSRRKQGGQPVVTGQAVKLAKHTTNLFDILGDMDALEY
ncbi:hypothetical protein LOZ12_003395 [Ophidiomyces ophidiicola]|uniref:Uncharacterized protein n=1 Tax=Ophidiomyces ophidiicola TaxID=1387563 RepID=A0ACB8UV55_9EURO|nr:uncharacterized protein LOZ57_003977 [Ophidiomyces ophidiicola]KAI1945726.1 hypothetical protein LOZ57_003977 [Ophidiomyces ophidiicola]KAI1950644.1 hypothetical protein LOZ62_001909 [Ophidiomyces ophidiicola]KAI1972607.1 hypothetical protein LOZ56_002317 [Ophidiomyces ophidiicola]KAI2006641.1 hypothetical protein LOZ50_003026 [Ophidiomyces ophidiicola]KAI2018352.1 hypothetical protein LOZ46_003940 [Ophidiomyces ophidiicola]